MGSGVSKLAYVIRLCQVYVTIRIIIQLLVEGFDRFQPHPVVGSHSKASEVIDAAGVNGAYEQRSKEITPTESNTHCR